MKRAFAASGVAWGFVLAVWCCIPAAHAAMEWEVVKNITIGEAPLDISLSRDGATAYILGKEKIHVFSTRLNKVTNTIPLSGSFSQLELAPDGETLFLTGADTQQISIIRISQTYDIAVGKSPIIGKADAAVTVTAFLDYQ